MIRLSPQIILLLLSLLPCLKLTSTALENPKIKCIESERQALIKFKQNLQDESNLLSSWGSEEEKRDCCKWVGVKCAKDSSHVISLNFSPSTFNGLAWVLEGNINDSLIELKQLNHLDLSYMKFDGCKIPTFLGSLSKLRYLSLSNADDLNGEVPSQLGKLSSLETLDLGYTNVLVSNMDWISQLSSLRQLDLSGVNLSTSYNWFQTVNKLHFLTHLHLINCDLPDITFTSSSYSTSTSLTNLDLSMNKLSVPIEKWLFNLSRSFTKLDLSNNKLRGFIPEALLNMVELAHLDLSNNQLEGEIPKSIWNPCNLSYLSFSTNNLVGEVPKMPLLCENYSLEYLDLSKNQLVGTLPNLTLFSSLKELSLFSNQLNGTPPESLGLLSKLEKLYMSNNSFKGVISETHFLNLSKLKILVFSLNPSLVFKFQPDWIPPFHLANIALQSCKLGPHFPKWLKTQKYSSLDISNTQISDSIPTWFWDQLSGVYINISNNQIFGTIPNVSLLNPESFPIIDLSANQLDGSIPMFLFQVSSLHLAENKFTEINSMCNVKDGLLLGFLDISYNELSGELPNCWSNFKALEFLVLAKNKLSGKIPSSIGSLSGIITLHLSSNNFSGELPLSMKNCTNLVVLDVGDNNLMGTIPKWIGERLTKLMVLILRSNNFNGFIPLQLCGIENLQLLDFSINNISGNVPKCFYNFSTMKQSGSKDAETAIKQVYSFNLGPGLVQGYFFVQVELMWKRVLSKYRNTLGLVKSIDLSRNELTGDIPKEIGQLIGLVSLNLSKNSLSGQIPKEMGHLKSLDVLDLSKNQLSGRIPLSLSGLDRLSVLDLSSNNLSGKIPSSTQLQSFDISSYIGNSQLCGAPLPKTCPGEEPDVTQEIDNQKDEKEGFISKGFYVSMGLGFGVGFWGFCGPILFINSLRHAYFNILNHVRDWIFVMVAMKKAKVISMIRS